MKKLFFALILAVILTACGSDTSIKDFSGNSLAAVQMKKAPVLTIQAPATREAIKTVQVTVKGFTNVVGSRVKIKYNPAMITLAGQPKVKVTGAMAAMNTTVAGEIVVAWFIFPPNSVTLMDGAPMLEIPFKAVKAGTSQIVFVDDQGGNACSTLYKPNNLADDTPFATYYLPGSVTFN